MKNNRKKESAKITTALLLAAMVVNSAVPVIYASEIDSFELAFVTSREEGCCEENNDVEWDDEEDVTVIDADDEEIIVLTLENGVTDFEDIPDIICTYGAEPEGDPINQEEPDVLTVENGGIAIAGIPDIICTYGAGTEPEGKPIMQEMENVLIAEKTRKIEEQKADVETGKKVVSKVNDTSEADGTFPAMSEVAEITREKNSFCGYKKINPDTVKIGNVYRLKAVRFDDTSENPEFMDIRVEGIKEKEGTIFSLRYDLKDLDRSIIIQALDLNTNQPLVFTGNDLEWQIYERVAE